MSLIALRQVIRRQGKRAAMLLVVLSLTPLAAHHAGVSDAGADGGPAHHQVAGHGAESPAEPATSIDQAAAACLAILPVLLAAMLALGLLPRRWIRSAVSLSRAHARNLVPVPRRVLRPPRDGPGVLCVMRC